MFPDTHRYLMAQSRTGFLGNPSGNSHPRRCGWCLRPTPVTFCCPDPLHRSLVRGASHLQSKALTGIRFRILVLGLSLTEDKEDRRWVQPGPKAAAGIWGTAAACFPTPKVCSPRLSRTSLAEGPGPGCGTSSYPRARERRAAPSGGATPGTTVWKDCSLPSLRPSGCELSCSSEPAVFIRATPKLNNSL